jgi:hypothetical protein
MKFYYLCGKINTGIIIMTTIALKESDLNANHFLLEFARTLPYVDIIEEPQSTVKQFKSAVSSALKKSEQGKDLLVCRNAEDMFTKLGL